LKAQILAECAVPGVSVARVAMSHGINANVLHRWRQRVREGGTTLVKVPMSTAIAVTALRRACGLTAFPEPPP